MVGQLGSGLRCIPVCVTTLAQVRFTLESSLSAVEVPQAVDFCCC